MNRKLKYFVYNLDRYSFSQIKLLRKWYGGKWTNISFSDIPFNVWVKGEPSKAITYKRIEKTEDWKW